MRYVQTSEIGLIIPPRWVGTRLHGPENFVKNEVFTQSLRGLDTRELRDLLLIYPSLDEGHVSKLAGIVKLLPPLPNL